MREEEVEELLKKTRRLKAATRNESAGKNKQNTLGENLGVVAGTILQIKSALLWLFLIIIKPLLRFLPFLKYPLFLFRDAWFFYCYPKQGFLRDLWSLLRSKLRSTEVVTSENESGQFSKIKAIVFISLTILILSFPLQIPFLKDFSFATVYEPPYDLSRIVSNALMHGGNIRSETLFLNGKNEIDADNNSWSITGCENQTDCPPEDAVYFRVKPSLVHMLWSLSTKQFPFIADDVAGVVPNVPSECLVKSYGSRWRLMKWVQSYPVALDISCKIN